MNEYLRKVSGAKTTSLLTKAGILAGVGLATWKIAAKRPRSQSSMQGKVVLITGSRGLGLALARELGHRGAIIALCARDEQELERAVRSLSREHVEAAAFSADISNQSEIKPLINQVLARFGRIDALVNNAGEISVGPVDAFAHSDFEHAMDLMFWAAVNLTFEVLPHMKAQHSGHIVNITSIGGRVSIPHLLPYSCAKFALVGFSTGISAEVRQQNINVLTVVPGLMRTGSHLHAQFKGQAQQEFAWFGLLGNIPGFSVAADYAARRIADAMEKRRYLLTISLPAKILAACETVLPEMTRGILACVNRFLLPKGTARDAHEGATLNASLGTIYQSLTVLGRRAAEKLNQ